MGWFGVLYTPYLTAHRETDQVGTKTESSALASRYTNRWRKDIEKSEDRRRDKGEGRNLIKGEAALGDIDGRHGNGETLQQILQGTIHKLANAKVHFFYTLGVENIYARIGRN
jgi:hypothetical protein